MNVLWVIIVIALVCVTLNGYREGFVKILFAVFSKIVILILVLFLTPFVTEFIIEEKILEQPKFIVFAGSFGICYLVLFALSKLLFVTLDILAKLPVIKRFDKILGLPIGLLQGLLSVWIFFAVLSLLQKVHIASGLLLMIEQSIFLKMLYHNNLILVLLQTVLDSIKIM